MGIELLSKFPHCKSIEFDQLLVLFVLHPHFLLPSQLALGLLLPGKKRHLPCSNHNASNSHYHSDIVCHPDKLSPLGCCIHTDWLAHHTYLAPAH
jgi:hypothetical protein